MWCTLHPHYSNGKGMREACLDKVANVQDSDAVEKMQGTSGVVLECVTMWVVYKDGQQIKPEAVMLGSCREVTFCRVQQLGELCLRTLVFARTLKGHLS